MIGSSALPSVLYRSHRSIVCSISLTISRPVTYMPLRLVCKENRSTPRDDSLCRSRDFRSGSMLISLKVCSIKILSISNKDTPSVPASSPPDEAYQPTLAKATHRARCLAKCFRRGAAPLVRCCVARLGRRPRVCESQHFCITTALGHGTWPPVELQGTSADPLPNQFDATAPTK